MHAAKCIYIANYIMESVFQKITAAANDTSRRLYIPSPFSTPAPPLLDPHAASNANLYASPACKNPRIKHYYI